MRALNRDQEQANARRVAKEVRGTAKTMAMPKKTIPDRKRKKNSPDCTNPLNFSMAITIYRLEGTFHEITTPTASETRRMYESRCPSV